MFCDNTPIVHLQIDVQDRFLDKFGFNKRRRTAFVEAARKRVEDLREMGIPTVHVAYRRDEESQKIADTPRKAYWKLFSTRLTQRPDNTLAFLGDVRASLELAVPVSADDLVFVKTKDSTFARKKLASFLHARNCQTVLISGMNTCACVAESASGSVFCGFKTFVMADVLAEVYGLRNERPEGDVAEHIRLFNLYVENKAKGRATTIDGRHLLEHVRRGGHPQTFLDQQITETVQDKWLPLLLRHPILSLQKFKGQRKAKKIANTYPNCRCRSASALIYGGV